jgi:amino acid adenylation domain-containing protein
VTIPALLSELRSRDIHIWADGDQLQCNAPADVLTPELRDQLRRRKSEILEFLRGPAVLSFAQQRLWFLDQIEPGGSAYIMAGALELRGALDAPALERALGALVDRHEALRTLFVSVEGQPQQVVSEPGAWTLPVVDLSGEAHARERLAQRLREEVPRGFDLARGPLFRAQLYRLAPDSHVLLLAMHHIISDGWSLGILMRELGQLYGCFSRGEAPVLPAPRLQYRDFARWQRSWLQGEALEVQLSHWRSRLAGAPQVLELPADRPRPAVESNRGAIYAFTLPLELANALRGLARREGATLYMTLLAGFTLLLSRYSGQQDLLVGTPVANRNRAEIEDVVGFFVNTLVLRADLSGNPSAREFLARTREACLDAYAHQDLPFERLVEEMRPARDMSRNPLFQVMFALQNAPIQPLELPGLTLTPVDVERGAVQFDLTLTVQESVEGLIGVFNYATDLFNESTIARMATHWRTLLEAMIASPQRRVADLPLLSEAERHQVLVEWNDTRTDYPRGKCIHELFEEQAARTPDAVAVEYEGRRLTYGELSARANQVARYLARHGVGPDVLVALFVERSLEMLVGIVGILKAGGAYVPIDPAYPKERLGYILEESKSPVVLTQESLVDGLPSFAGHSICLDADWAEIVCEPEENLVTHVRSEHLAYVLFTSGSTGRPKGVALEHRSAATFVQWGMRVFAPKELAGVLFSTSVCFDLSVFEMFVTLSAGGKVIVARDALHLSTLPEKDAVTLINTVPSAIAELLRMDAVPASVKTVNLAGEALSDTLVEQIYANTNVEKVYNLYGPTETTTYSTYTLVRRGCPVTIGRPIADTQCYILDASRNPVPIGVMGELYLAGGGLARGYYARPELTNERFVPNPFSEERGGRMYRTGDLCRWLPDGNIQYQGRRDHQVKLRGYRIELGEIEAVLAEHPEVRQAAVHLWQVKANDVRIVACCVPAKAGVFAPISLRKHMRARLPEYMVPQHFLLVEEIPLTPNGKVDRSKLPTPPVTEGHFEQHEAPSDPVEATIAEIWTKLIHPARPIGRADKFFEMGGHSLLALRVSRQMEQKLGVRLDFRILFQESLADIATRCRPQRTAQGGGDSGAARPVARPAETGLKERVTQASRTS